MDSAKKWWKLQQNFEENCLKTVRKIREKTGKNTVKKCGKKCEKNEKIHLTITELSPQNMSEIFIPISLKNQLPFLPLP